MKRIIILFVTLIAFNEGKTSTVIVNDTIQISGPYPQISWNTTMELNNNYFKVMRSYDSLSWAQVRLVDGAGNSGTLSSYSIIDSAFTQTGTKVFYQICDVDFGGMQNCYSPMKYDFATGIFSKNATLKLSFTVSPNPAQKTLIISIQNYREGKFYEIEIVSSMGKIEYHRPIAGTEGVIDVSSLSNGSYIVNLFIDKKKHSSKKVIISN